MAKRMRICKDDQVMVIGGKDAGKTGRVVRTEPKKNRVYVEHLNMIKRHERPRSQTDLKTPRRAASSKRRGRSTFPT
jgi:large subunit ribosomal protein L24